MPAKNLHRANGEGIYSHIYNKGVEKRTIFNDEEDYEVFLGFLKDYLTAPQDPESIKKDFTVHGRIFRGTPHQPKNYLSKVELIAYSLMPDHFHLLLHQKTRGSIEKFLRSLCTRYSMYFNKKYQHTGALFEGPYRSAQIEDDTRLLLLTRHLHDTENYSSYAEYLGKRETLWVKPKIVQSFFDKAKTDLFKGTHSYKDIIEKYEPDQKEKELLKGITFDSETEHLARRDLASNVENHPPKTPIESSEKIYLGSNLNHLQRIPEIALAILVFVVLIALGIRGINTSPHKVLGSSSSFATPVATLTPLPVVKALATHIPSPVVEEKKAKAMLRVKINDASASASINIYQKPTANSEKIGQAKDGDIFEFVSVDSRWWYGVRLEGGSTGFIPAIYLEKGGENN